ncbi:DUF6228 family protein [Streptomyces sp. NPDC057052]|uniref:DUF6228 family protein n=1 Tax=Streptomyces sp. NPDC057052 TaxID=3346010 RepID=UPI0036273A6F
MVPGPLELVVRRSGAQASSVWLFDWSRADEHEFAFAVEGPSAAVRARLETVAVTAWNNMSEFFDGLARDFRGGGGERVWGSNHLTAVGQESGPAGHGPEVRQPLIPVWINVPSCQGQGRPRRLRFSIRSW